MKSNLQNIVILYKIPPLFRVFFIFGLKMKIFTWIFNFFSTSIKFLKCPKKQIPKPENPKKPASKPKNSKKRKLPRNKLLFGNDLINQPYNFPFQASQPEINGWTEKTFLIHERMSLNFKKVCLNGSGIIYESSIFRVCSRFRLKKNRKTLKAQFLLSNISEHTEISFLELSFQPNPGLFFSFFLRICKTFWNRCWSY